MRHRDASASLRVPLSDDRRDQLIRALKLYYADNFDETLSDFQADGLLRFFVQELGPPIYNQGVKDAAAFVQSRLDDLEGEVFHRE